MTVVSIISMLCQSMHTQTNQNARKKSCMALFVRRFFTTQNFERSRVQEIRSSIFHNPNFAYRERNRDREMWFIRSSQQTLTILEVKIEGTCLFSSRRYYLQTMNSHVFKLCCKLARKNIKTKELEEKMTNKIIINIPVAGPLEL